MKTRLTIHKTLMLLGLSALLFVPSLAQEINQEINQEPIQETSKTSKRTKPNTTAWRFGPVFGATASELTEIETLRNIPSSNFDPLEEEIEYKIGMVLGGFVGYKWPSGKLGASMEVFLAQRGVDYELNATRLSDGAKITEKIEFNYNYLSMPFLIRYYPYRGLNLGVGPQIAFNLTPTNIKYESSTDGVPNDNDLNTQQLQRQWLKAKGDMGFVFALLGFVCVCLA